MPPFPAAPLRRTLATWAVPVCRTPAVAAALLDALPPEAFDLGFVGQGLATTYFDTAHFDLRKARLRKDRYLTLRVRRYRGRDAPDAFALSAKTESDKWRVEVPPDQAAALLHGNVNAVLASYLPGALLARLLELTNEQPLCAAVTVRCRRYAVENDRDRLTLDVEVRTDAGRCLPYGVLEFKSARTDSPPPARLGVLELRPLKISKFLWATVV